MKQGEFIFKDIYENSSIKKYDKDQEKIDEDQEKEDGIFSSIFGKISSFIH